VGLSMSGSTALIYATYHPNQFKYAGSLSGFLNLSVPFWPPPAGLRANDSGGFNPGAMWGPPGDPAWARNDPTVNVAQLVATGSPRWVDWGGRRPGGPVRGRDSH